MCLYMKEGKFKKENVDKGEKKCIHCIVSASAPFENTVMRT